MTGRRGSKFSRVVVVAAAAAAAVVVVGVVRGHIVCRAGLCNT